VKLGNKKPTTFNFWRNKLALLKMQKSRTNLAINQLLTIGNVPKDTVFVSQQLDNSTPFAVIRLKSVMARTGLSRSSIYDRLDSGSKRHDRSFPTQIRLGANGRAVGWLSNEIDSWLLSQVTFSRGALGSVQKQ